MIFSHSSPVSAPLRMKASAGKEKPGDDFTCGETSCFFFWFPNEISFHNTKQTLTSGVRVNEDKAYINLSIYSQAKKTTQCSQAVLSTAQTYQRIQFKFYERKKKGKGAHWSIPSFVFSCVASYRFVCFILFSNQPGSVQPCCAVTRLDCDQHLKQWHSGGPAHCGSSS